MCLGLLALRVYMCVCLKHLVHVLEVFHKQDEDIPAYLEYKYVLLLMSHKCNNSMYMRICTHFAEININTAMLLHMIYRPSFSGGP